MFSPWPGGMVLGGLEFSTVRNSTVKNGCDNSIKSALGQKQTSETHAHNVRFTPESGHKST
jgi:hypothetical protein